MNSILMGGKLIWRRPPMKSPMKYPGLSSSWSSDAGSERDSIPHIWTNPVQTDLQVTGPSEAFCPQMGQLLPTNVFPQLLHICSPGTLSLYSKGFFCHSRNLWYLSFKLIGILTKKGRTMSAPLLWDTINAVKLSAGSRYYCGGRTLWCFPS